jgi:hypothetical protein
VAASPAVAVAQAKPRDIFEEEPVRSARVEQIVSADEPPGHAGSPRRSRAGAYVLGGLGLAAMGGYALLTYWGRKDNADLDLCSPNCPWSDIQHIQRLYIAADISAGVGVLALAASTWLFVRSGSSSTEVAAKSRSYVLDVKPTSSGAFATVSGAF